LEMAVGVDIVSLAQPRAQEEIVSEEADTTLGQAEPRNTGSTWAAHLSCAPIVGITSGVSGVANTFALRSRERERARGPNSQGVVERLRTTREVAV
jgi:hypothetical protein